MFSLLISFNLEYKRFYFGVWDGLAGGFPENMQIILEIMFILVNELGLFP